MEYNCKMKFQDHNQLLDKIFNILDGRKDLIPLKHIIRKALKKDSITYGFKNIDYLGIVLPKPRSTSYKHYTIQIVIDNPNGRDYQNIRIGDHLPNGYESYQGEKFLG